MAERFIYIPSLGLILVLCWVLVWLFHRAALFNRYIKLAYLVILLAIAGGLSAKTIQRNTAWKDDLTLFTTDVRLSSNSAKAQATAGASLLGAARSNSSGTAADSLVWRAVYHLERAVEIYPSYGLAWSLLGLAYSKYLDNQTEAVRCYRELVRHDPRNLDGYRRLGIAAAKAGDFETVVRTLPDAMTAGGRDEWLFEDLGVAYRNTGDFKRAVRTLRNGIQHHPKSARLYRSLAATYLAMGDQQNGSECLRRAGILEGRP
jgi:Flp pilus assembly protein TadD